ncbi:MULTISPECIES: hypothetical protein [Bifidobacterium]|jgi:hypothetical protein|uniref:Uncharacterized protein n=1 Tax=Bifidobacterium subtile TaxID=77635 RepID=A0A087E5R6_9BIFI|nr:MULTISPECIES: hypothetical protein [Bifidobacterium]KFJ03117.1 hypothetical protein BISU_1049 [Bifidobacterium subtile]MCH3974394.1 hypothetical protein [Bifidobacterium tibiigranuli]MCH4190055.1 hypothetical protein [Bifidobacterium tibiigranuli]MCH4204710.1 hypothetical protein [Bifidobacterium tibiigranuli]MCH4275478.1 hypothetical protein [Bifidobacterium tibiigranuli]
MKNVSSRFALLRGVLFWLGVLAMSLGVYAGIGFLLYFLIGLAGVWHPSYLLCVVAGGFFAMVSTLAFLAHELIVSPEMADLDKGAK